MKEFKDRLFSIKDSQAKLLKEYNALIEEYESHDLLQENQTLRKQYEEYKSRLAELQEKYKQAEEENTRLRTSLTEQIIDEKLNIVKVSREKLQTYFDGKASGHSNRLSALEYEAKTSMNRLYDKAAKQLTDEKHDILAKLEQLNAELNQRLLQQRERMAAEEKEMFSDVAGQLDLLAAEEVDEATIQRRIKQNQIEMKIGLNWINKLGILLIILGVGAAFRYSYSTWFTGYMKGTAFFLFGALMLAAGEWFYRKEKRTFALGLLGGGVSVLYGSIFYSYFLLEIINMAVGLSLSVFVSVTAVLLSLRYRSRTICSIGLAGGYLPLFSYMAAFGLEGNAVYAAMVYLFLLNLFILLISFRQRWAIVNYISFLLNVPSMAALINIADSEPISILYAVVTFLMYLGITLGYPFIYRSRLLAWDVVLLALNTFISCILLYALFDSAGWDDLRGLLAAVFCLVYLGLAKYIDKFMKEEKQTKVLFYITSLTFAILAVPFQFGVDWLSLGWLVEGVLLIVFGSLRRHKPLERAGWGIFLLCLGAFYLYDFLWLHALWFNDSHYFNLKFSSIMIGMLLVTFYYAIQMQKGAAVLSGRLLETWAFSGFKYFALIHVWFYLLYEKNEIYDRLVSINLSHYDFYDGLLNALITIGLAYSLTKLKMLYDRAVKVYCLFLYIAGYLVCLYVTMTTPALEPEYALNSAEEYIALAILIAFNIFVFFSGRDFLIAFIRRQYKSIELYPLILGVYLIGILTAFLNVQFQLGDVSLLFSLLYLALAIGFIMYGFLNKYVYIRRLGLGLSLLSTGKLFLYDLSFLEAGSKIVAYFAFGVVLLGISFIYQKLSNKLGDTRVESGKE